jgi:hypothetical protein
MIAAMFSVNVIFFAPAGSAAFATAQRLGTSRMLKSLMLIRLDGKDIGYDSEVNEFGFSRNI